jgi:hypothetical protein
MQIESGSGGDTLAFMRSDSGMESSRASRFTKFMENFPRSTLASFLPAIVTWQCVLYVLTYNHQGLGSLWNDVFPRYWPLSLGLLPGSIVAGCTPLGGGFVAFPLAVLLFDFTSEQGRDVSVLTQAIGLNAAAYLLCLNKSHLLDFTLITCFVVCGVPGILVGLAVKLPAIVPSLIYTAVVFLFGIVFFYTNNVDPSPRPACNVAQCPNASKEGGGQGPVDASLKGLANGKGAANGVLGSLKAGLSLVPRVATEAELTDLDVDPQDVATPSLAVRVASYALMVPVAFIGGFITANVGSGSDISLFSCAPGAPATSTHLCRACHRAADRASPRPPQTGCTCGTCCGPTPSARTRASSPRRSSRWASTRRSPRS